MDDEIRIPGRDDNPELFKQFLVGHGGPAFLRRSSQVRAAYEQLLDRCRQQRNEWLAMVRLRLATLHALAGGWDRLRLLLQEEGLVNALELVHSELNPQLRSEVAPTTSLRSLRRALAALVESIERFNRRWLEYLRSIDLSAVNELRHGYNRYYVLEKECAMRSPRLARQGFHRLEPLTWKDLETLLPPLPVPRAKDSLRPNWEMDRQR